MLTIMMDVDGVLVSGRPADGAHLFTDLERDLGIPLAVLQQEFFKPHWAAIVTGQMPLEPELASVLARIAPDVDVETLIRYWFENDSRLDLAVLDAIAALRGQGHRVFLATNQEHRRAHYFMQTMGLAAHVDGIVYSAALGHRKPDVQFYARATQTVAATNDAIILIDDTEANVIAARTFGWMAIHYKPGLSIIDAIAAQTGHKTAPGRSGN